MRFYDIQLSLSRVRVWEMGRQRDPPVLLLHGGGVDHARLSWEPTLYRLASLGFRAIAPDFPGYGDSPHPGRPVALEFLRDTVGELLDSLNLERVVLVGISMGGGTALAFALQQPERVKALVLVGAYGLSSHLPGGRWAAALVRMPQPQWVNETLSRSPFLLNLTLRGILRNSAARTPELREIVAEAMHHSSPAWNEFQQSEIAPGATRLKTNFAPELPRLTMPVLVFHGQQDATIPHQDVTKAFAALPHAEVHIVPHAGHWTQRDASAEFHSQLARFLFQEVSE